MNESKLEELREKYLEVLKINIEACPDAYPWLKPTKIYGNVETINLLAKTPEQVTNKIIESVRNGSFTIDANSSPTLNEAVRLLGIKPTQKALKEWLNDIE